MYDFYYNNKQYTLVDIYKEKDGIVVQLNSDDDIILFFVDKQGLARKLTPSEEKDFRKKHYLIDYGYVTSDVKDFINLDFHAKRMGKIKEEDFKKFFLSRIQNLDSDLIDSKYINHRLKALSYKHSSNQNSYSMNTVYYLAQTDWILTHETVHGIVNKSNINTYALIEGITDYIVSKILPHGNYSQNHLMIGGKIQVNDSGSGQNHLVVFAKQLEYALGSEYNIYEMFAFPHNQIKKFGSMYNPSKCRILNHKLNVLYHNYTIENFKIVQQFMLEMIFDKKIELVNDSETAKKYFDELIKFGLLRGRINGRDEDLQKYYEKQKLFLKNKGIDISKVSNYYDEKFYPCGDCYLRYDKYIDDSIKAKKNGKGNNFKILYNKDCTCVYIIVDGVLNFIQNESFDNRRLFTSNMINSLNSKVVYSENGNYVITGPDGITEEAIETNASKIIDNYFKKLQSSTKRRK